jgi:hypothetical protein
MRHHVSCLRFLNSPLLGPPRHATPSGVRGFGDGGATTPAISKEPAMRTATSALVALSALALVACSGPAEDAAHRRADAVDAAGERQADALERQAAATSNEAEETALNQRADAVENAADGRSDAMHRQVDKDF